MKRNELFCRVDEFESKHLSIELLREGAKLVFEIEMAAGIELSEYEYRSLVCRVDKKAKDVFHELEPNFNELTLSEMVKVMHNDNTTLLKDITVIDGTVFVTEDMVNYKGETLDTRTRLYVMPSQFSYDTICNSINNYQKDGFNRGCDTQIYEMMSNKKIVKELIRFVVDNINGLMKNKHPETALYFMEIEDSIRIECGIPNTVIYINLPLFKLYYGYVNKMPVGGEIIVRTGDTYVKFRIIQQFSNNKPIWIITEQLDIEVWRLSEHVKNNELGGSAYQARPIDEQDV